MRHLKNKKTLDRKRGPRVALIRSLARNLILHEKVRTTVARAKVIRPFVERLVTVARENTLHSRRLLLQKLGDQGGQKDVVEILLKTIGPRYKERAGGYLRITKLYRRPGDNAEEAIIEFVS